MTDLLKTIENIDDTQSKQWLIRDTDESERRKETVTDGTPQDVNVPVEQIQHIFMLTQEEIDRFILNGRTEEERINVSREVDYRADGGSTQLYLSDESGGIPQQSECDDCNDCELQLRRALSISDTYTSSPDEDNQD